MAEDINIFADEEGGEYGLELSTIISAPYLTTSF